MSKLIDKMLSYSSKMLETYGLENTTDDIEDIADDAIFHLDNEKDLASVVAYIKEFGNLPEYIHYENMPVVVGEYPETRWEPAEYIEGEADWDYKYDQQLYGDDDIINYIGEIFPDQDILTGAQVKIIAKDEYQKFYDYLKDIHEQHAAEDAWDNYDYTEHEDHYGPEYSDSIFDRDM